jgi:hypothetical protein
MGAEGVGDALVGGFGLPVDVVSVDLEQDGGAVPRAAGDLGDGLRRLKVARWLRVRPNVSARA